MQSVVKILQDLVAIPSVNPMGREETGSIYGERAIAEHVRDFLGRLGVDAEIYGADPKRPNLIARIDGGCSETVMLEAHMDTVRVDDMSIDPFDPQIRDGKLWGRGSCDTKASLATYLSAITAILEKGIRLTRNVVLATVHDEEYSFGGVKALAKKGVSVDFAIAGEPTELNIIHAHKGVCRFYVSTEGKSAHAALPWLGDNAIYSMARVVERIERYGKQLEERVDPVFGRRTVNVGRIMGGQAVNIVPPTCRIEVDRRLLPGEGWATVKPELEAALEGADARWRLEEPYLEVPGLFIKTTNPACQALLKACQQAGIKPSFESVDYATDAAVLMEASIPAVVFGPGSIAQAHTKDEYVSIDQVEQASQIILNLISQG